MEGADAPTLRIVEEVKVGLRNAESRRILVQEYSIAGDRLQRTIKALSYTDGAAEVDASCTILYTKEDVPKTEQTFFV